MNKPLIESSKWEGSTHKVPMFLLGVWRRVFCKRGWHCFDEVWAPPDHYLSCDACELVYRDGTWDRTYVITPTRKGGDG